MAVVLKINPGFDASYPWREIGTGTQPAAASSLEKDLRTSLKTGADIEAAKVIGKLLAERAVAKGVKDVLFDRGGYIFHGRVKALADAARESGLNF